MKLDPLHVPQITPRPELSPSSMPVETPETSVPHESLEDRDNHEIQKAQAKRRVLDMMKHPAEPPLFVRALAELKQLWKKETPPSKMGLRADQAPHNDPPERATLVDWPETTVKLIDALGSIRIMNSDEVTPSRGFVQTNEPPELLPGFLPLSTGTCTTCGRGGRHAPGHVGTRQNCTNCGQGRCVPGQPQGYPCETNTLIGGYFCDLYSCLCCPDPCYEPKWIPQADAAFFVDAARPVSQMKIGWDGGLNLIFPDRSEYFWARADGSGKGPRPTPPALGERRLRYNDLVVYTETAAGGLSAIVNFPYRSVSPEIAAHASGFTDMTVGTKSLLFDCELLTLSLQMLTTIPTGNFSKGLGNGHLSLEPSLLFSLKLSHNTYMQGQISEWIPLGGDPNYSGAILHTHSSVNHVFCRVLPDVPIIGTLEVNTWSFQDGAYTDPNLGSNQRSGGRTYVSMGPGLRVFVCNRVDFGAGAAFAVTDQHFAQTVVRVMFRYRF